MPREDTFFSRTQTIALKGELHRFNRPVIMGIVNLTPDSFYAGSRAQAITACCKIVEQQLIAGADWVDLGAMSTRPGAEILTENTENQRLLPILEALVKTFPGAIFSVDTYRAGVATAAVNTGAAIINDVTGGMGDEKMVETVARLRVPYIAMHSRGNAQTMQGLTQYQALPDDIIAWFINRLNVYARAGIADTIVDPGIGFAKTTEQNFMLLQQLHEFKMLGKPILAGISRKSFIAKTLGTDAAGALNGTTALHMTCLMNGANILRAHDVKEAVETRKLFEKLSA